MAAQLKLVKREDMGSDVDSIDLLDAANGLALANDGWIPNTPDKLASLFATVQEAMTLRVTGTSQDNLAAVLQALTDKKQQAEWYSNEYERYGVWLRAQLDTETGARQALVKTLKHRPNGDFFSPGARYGYKLIEHILGIERVGLWEAPSYVGYSLSSPYQILPIGGKVDYGTGGLGTNHGPVPGDVPARIPFLSVLPHSGTPIYQLWIGFRSDRLGDRSKFQSTWGLRRASSFGADTTGGTSNFDVQAFDQYKTVTTFATTPGLARRVTIRLSDVTPDILEQRGEFQVILRAKLSSAGVVRVRLADGLYGSTGYNLRPRVVIDKTNWYFYDLGLLKIPNTGRLIETTFIFSNLALGIDAERVSGTPQLQMDVLVQSPISEGSIYACDESATVTTTNNLFVEQRPDGKVYGAWSAGAATSWPRVTVNQGLPIGNGIAVFTSQAVDQSSIDHRIDEFNMYYIPRWETLRGAD